MAEAKVKKKNFVKIISSKQFNEQIIGESLVEDSRLLIGRNIRVNMMSLTNDPKNQNVQLKFKINSLKGDSVGTEFIGYTLLPSFIKRLVRKDKKRVDDCFTTKTSDNRDIIIKTFMLTLNKTTKSVLAALRKSTRETLKIKINGLSFEQLMNEIIPHRLQSEMRKKLSKIYPLKQCEVRDLQVKSEYVEEGKKISEPKGEVKLEKVEEEKSEVKKEIVKEVSKSMEVKPEIKKELVKEEELKEPKVEAKKEISEIKEISDDAQKSSISDKVIKDA